MIATTLVTFSSFQFTIYPYISNLSNLHCISTMAKLINVIVVILAVAYFAYKSPYVDPVAFKSNLLEKLDGVVAMNDKLDKAERLYENKIHWPESFAAHEGQLYTGLGDGRIVRLSSNDVTEISKIGQCAGQHEEHLCGRPLGMTFSKTGTLYVVDAYFGLFSVDVKTGKRKNLLPSSKVVDGLPLTFLNSVTFDSKDETLYITQSTTKWNISHVLTSIIEHESSGRLLKYELKTKKTTVLLKDLGFPNGVELSHDGNAILIANLNDNKISKYHIIGPKKGTVTEFVPTLPGEPDNIKRTKRGTYWIGTSMVRSRETPTLIDHVSEKPILRKLLLNAHRLLTTPISLALSLVPFKTANEIALELRSLRIIADVVTSYAGIVEIDEKGKIVRALYSSSGQVKHLSEAFEHDGYLYLGSWRNNYLGRLKISDL